MRKFFADMISVGSSIDGVPFAVVCVSGMAKCRPLMKSVETWEIFFSTEELCRDHICHDRHL